MKKPERLQVEFSFELISENEIVMEAKATERPRKRAARIIKQVETHGGFPMSCGCVVGASAVEIRRLMEMAGPEAVLEISTLLECPKHRT